MQSNLMDLITIDRRSTIHYDIQLKENIKSLVLDQTYGYNTKLPTVKELAKHLNLDEELVLSSYKMLVNERYISLTKENVFHISFFELTNYFFDRNTAVYDAIKALGLHPSIECLDRKVFKLKKEKIESLGFDPKKGNKFFYINRIYKGDDQPIMLLENYIPLDIFPDIAEKFKGDEPLNAYLIEHYGIRAEISKRITKAINMPKKVAALLHERKNAASLHSTNHLYDKYDRLIDFSQSYTICSYYFQALIERDEMNTYFPEKIKL